jgi:hypothetical protein
VLRRIVHGSPQFLIPAKYARLFHRWGLNAAVQQRKSVSGNELRFSVV